jgi:hypothetical protein
MTITEVTVYIPLAHLGHWYWLVLFLAPAVLVLAGAIRTAIQERRKARDEGSSKDPED